LLGQVACALSSHLVHW